MPTNEDRLWDVAIGEAVTGRQPPDLLAIILARSIEPARASLPRPRWQRVTWRALQVSAAAGVLLAIGVLTGLVKWPSSAPGETPEPRNMIAAPGAKWYLEGSAIMLESGELLLSTGAPEVRHAGSTFAVIDGLALVRAGREPTPDQDETLKAWLETKGVEADMIRNATKWLQGTALCALMLQGTATLDGQKVEAEKPAAEPVWHRVNNVMDIDKLPEGAKHVNADGLKCTHLDFLADVKALKSLSLRGGEGMKAEYLSALSRLPALDWLDLSRVTWVESVDYSSLLALPSLKHLAIDPFPSVNNGDDNWDGCMDVLKQLSARKVSLSLGWFSAVDGRVNTIVDAMPGLTGLEVADATDEDLKRIAKMPNLQSLKVRGPITDIGFAYLARGLKLTHLECSPEDDISRWFQIGRMQTLQSLKIEGLLLGNGADNIAQLQDLKNLRVLNLVGVALGSEPYEDSNTGATKWRDAPIETASLGLLPLLEILEIREDSVRGLWAAFPTLKAKCVKVWTKIGDSTNFSGEKVEIAESSVIEKLVLCGEIDLGTWKGNDAAARVLSACPRLVRIEVKQVPEVGELAVKPYLDMLRKAAPKATVAYVP